MAMRELIIILAASMLAGCSEPPPVQLQCTIDGRASYTSSPAAFVHLDGGTYRIAQQTGAMTFAYEASYTTRGGEICVVVEVQDKTMGDGDA